LRLNADQLPAALSKNVAGVYLVSGDEPLLVGEAADAIRAAARLAGYADRTVFFIDRSFAWDELRHASQSLSLFAERRLFELRMPSGKPDKGAQQLAELAERPPPDVVCLVVTDKLDKKASDAAWVKAVERHGVWVPIWPVQTAALPGWLPATKIFCSPGKMIGSIRAWAAACTPVPTMAAVSASPLAHASRETAVIPAVREAVIPPPSMMHRGTPVSGSFRMITADNVGRPMLGFPGKSAIHFNPSAGGLGRKADIACT
jgi:hypothetical protein